MSWPVKVACPLRINHSTDQYIHVDSEAMLTGPRHHLAYRMLSVEKTLEGGGRAHGLGGVLQNRMQKKNVCICTTYTVGEDARRSYLCTRQGSYISALTSSRYTVPCPPPSLPLPYHCPCPCAVLILHAWMCIHVFCLCTCTSDAGIYFTCTSI